MLRDRRSRLSSGEAVITGPSRDRMLEVVQRYMDGCNRADAAAITSCLDKAAIHYFPPGMYGGPWKGADVIARNWLGAVARLGSYWTVERLVCDVDEAQAVCEWTHWKTIAGKVLRGDEWYRFDRGTGLIVEIRAYYASPQDWNLDVLELAGFNYAAEGYAMSPPTGQYPRT